jgi:hypothetical protein
MFRPTILLAAVLAALPAAAAVDLDEEGYRLYCGYLDALEQPAIQKLSGKKKDAQIAKMAKVSPKKLLEAVSKGEVAGATCDEVAKRVKKDAKTALDAALPGRIQFFEIDETDPSHVVASVRWLGVDQKKLFDEASLIAFVLSREAPIVKTIAIRAVDPQAKDSTADEAIWLEARITRMIALRIQKEKIADYAQSRYKQLFDGQRGKMVAATSP